MDNKKKALLAYMSMVDAGTQAAELSATINKRVKKCLELLDTFLNLDDKKKPAMVEPYQPANYKPKPPEKTKAEEKS